MKYFRIVFKKENNQVAVSDIMEQSISDNEFAQMNWERPIIKHDDGKYLHFIALDPQYLDAMVAGIAAYMETASR